MYFFTNVIPVAMCEIENAERHFGVLLPDELKMLILEHNGASIECESGRMSALLSFSRSKDGNVYDLYTLPHGYLPFGDDGAEGCYAMSSEPNEGIVLWHHGKDKEIVAPDIKSFLKWLDEDC